MAFTLTNLWKIDTASSLAIGYINAGVSYLAKTSDVLELERISVDDQDWPETVAANGVGDDTRFIFIEGDETDTMALYEQPSTGLRIVVEIQ